MELNKTERELFLDLSFFVESRAGFLGRSLRPLSLASYKLMKHMGLSIMEEEHGLPLLEETRQIAAYIWLHSAPIDDICQAVWTGRWREILAAFDEPSEEIVAEFRSWRIRLVSCVKASEFHIRPRPPSPHDKTPRDVIGPTAFAFTVATVAHFVHVPPFRVRWHMFIAEALQYYHAARWSAGSWTVPPGREVKEEELSDLAPDWLKADIDSAVK